MESLARLDEERREQNMADEQVMRRKTVQDGRKVSRPEVDSERIWKNRAAQNARKHQQSVSVKAMPRGIASNEMCTFLILNISSLQLIPVNIIAYRSQYGSVNPTAIINEFFGNRDVSAEVIKSMESDKAKEDACAGE